MTEKPYTKKILVFDEFDKLISRIDDNTSLDDVIVKLNKIKKKCDY